MCVSVLYFCLCNINLPRFTRVFQLLDLLLSSYSGFYVLSIWYLINLDFEIMTIVKGLSRAKLSISNIIFHQA